MREGSRGGGIAANNRYGREPPERLQQDVGRRAVTWGSDCFSVPSQKFADIFRGGHPAWLRCPSFTYCGYAHSSRLPAGRRVPEYLSPNF